MKSLMRVLVFGLVVVFLFTSCAKKPTMQMDEAKAAVEAVTKDGEAYAKDELKALNDSLTAATDAVNAQSKKLFKSYGNAKEMLAKVKTDAEALKPVIAQRKEEAKNNAVAEQANAKTAVEEAATLVAKAPKGKGTRADIEAFKADLKACEDTLVEVQQAIDAENYLGAIEKAKAVTEKAAGISDQIKKAMAKVGRK
jgi:tRNA U34 5-carboxymethylaminomethyl modifying GTPase MnmE/TrmE